MVHFDLSLFSEIGSWLFQTGKQIFEMINFDFLGFTINGWILLLGLAVVFIVIWFIGRLFQ